MPTLLPTPLPVGMSFCAVAFQLASASFALPGTTHVQLLPLALPTVVLPREVSPSARSKQYSHWASELPLPSGV